MSTFPFGFRAAQAVGITGAAWLSGKLHIIEVRAQSDRTLCIRKHRRP